MKSNEDLEKRIAITIQPIFFPSRNESTADLIVDNIMRRAVFIGNLSLEQPPLDTLKDIFWFALENEVVQARIKLLFNPNEAENQ